MKPTIEQQACIDAFSTGKRLRINAYAGTGKTSTLTLPPKAAPRTPSPSGGVQMAKE
jgi:hypothetical protein